MPSIGTFRRHPHPPGANPPSRSGERVPPPLLPVDRASMRVVKRRSAQQVVQSKGRHYRPPNIAAVLRDQG
jgi:hypothetical protein